MVVLGQEPVVVLDSNADGMHNQGAAGSAVRKSQQPMLPLLLHLAACGCSRAVLLTALLGTKKVFCWVGSECMASRSGQFFSIFTT